MTGDLADETNRRPLSDGRRIEMSASGREATVARLGHNFSY